MKLYTLRHRMGNHGVLLSFIQINEPTGDEAKDFRIAEQIGVAYCDQHVNCKYIRIEPAILANESILDPAILDKIKNPPPPREKKRLPKDADIVDPDAKQTAEEAAGTTEKTRTPVSEGDLDNLDLGDDDEEDGGSEDGDDKEGGNDESDKGEDEKPKGGKPKKPAAKTTGKPKRNH